MTQWPREQSTEHFRSSFLFSGRTTWDPFPSFCHFSSQLIEYTLQDRTLLGQATYVRFHLLYNMQEHVSIHIGRPSITTETRSFLTRMSALMRCRSKTRTQVATGILHGGSECCSCQGQRCVEETARRSRGSAPPVESHAYVSMSLDDHVLLRGPNSRSDVWPVACELGAKDLPTAHLTTVSVKARR